MSSAENFIGYLEELRQNERRWSQARAVLRRSLAFAPGTYPDAYPFVEPRVGERSGWSREVLYVVAGLYALKEAHVPQRTLSRAFRETMDRKGSQSLEARFLTLLDSDYDQLAERLRRVAILVEGGFDFVCLQRDLERWFRPDRPVQQNWARDFYRSELTEAQTQLKEENS